jgi:hypothetical protein
VTIETDVRHGLQATSADAPGASVGPEQAARRVGPGRPLALLAAMVTLCALALGLRLIGLGGAVTEDEDQWIGRSGVFARALARGEWGRTYLTGHPGVTVMWLTTSTLGLDRASALATRTGQDVTTLPDFLPALQVARVTFAVVQALLVVATALMVGRPLGHPVGLLAGLLLAAEPFWAGVGPIVGMDGLLSGLLTVSLLALMLALRSEAGRGERLAWAALSGLTFGLAFLSKTTALLAGPMVPILVGVAAWQSRTGSPSLWKRTGVRAAWQGLASVVAVWGTLAVLTIWLVWPAAWTSPLTTVTNALNFSAELGRTPHRPGNVFFGQPLEDPGPAFYPVALALRHGPGTTVGLLLLLAFGAPAAWRQPTWTLLGFVALLLALLTLSPKKVDRYLLPTLPMLGILAAVGWYEAARRLGRLSQRDPSPSPSPLLRPPPPLPRTGEGDRGRGIPGARAIFVVALLALALQIWPLVVAGRFPLAAYNPLFGGSSMAERAIPIGWGDGLDVAGDRLRELAGGQAVVTAIWAPLRVNFGAHAPGPVVSQAQIGEADFYVDYVHARQRHLTPRQVVDREPDAVVTVNGIDYARVYRLR